jgi:hypothetical protein
MSLMLAACVSCSTFDYSADAIAKTEVIHFKTFGGSSALDSAGGTRLTQNHNKTAGQFFQTVSAVAGTVAAGYVQHGLNASNATTTQQLNTSTAATQQAQINAALEQSLATTKANAAIEALKLTR